MIPEADLILDTKPEAASTLVSVTIPCYRRAELVRKAVLSIFAQTLPHNEFELIVVDGSPETSVVDAMREIASQATCRFRVYRKQPEGPGPSRNVGAAQSDGAWLAFMDSDCQAAPNWLENAHLDDQPQDIGVMQGWTGPDPAEKLDIFKYYVTVDRENYIYEACNIFYRRAAFEQAGGFPRDLSPQADIIMGGEDLELAWMVKKLGWKSTFAASARVFHEVIPISLWRWIFIKRIFIWPYMTKRFPGLRKHWFGRYFFEPAQFYLCLLLIGIVTVLMFNPWCALLTLPYILHRSSGRSNSLKGPLRLVRPLFYLLRDTSSFGLLIAGSIRFRCLLL